LLLRGPPPPPTLFPYTTLFRSPAHSVLLQHAQVLCFLAGLSIRAAEHQHAAGLRDTVLDSPAHLAVERVREVKDHRTDNRAGYRSEEHTSELQSRGHLVCRLLL